MQWYKPEGRKTYDSMAPATGKKMCETIQGTQEDVDYAVGCAKKASVKWAALSGHERARHMYSIARHVQVSCDV